MKRASQFFTHHGIVILKRVPSHIFKSTIYLFILFTLLIIGGCDKSPKQEWGSNPYPWKAGQFGGAHLLTAPGELIVDLNIEIMGSQGCENCIRVLLASPDRKVITDTLLSVIDSADDNPELFSGSLLLKTSNSHRGIFSLSVINENDRRGTHTAWSMRTNAEAYVLETSTGHRDERHVEPIVVLDVKDPVNIGFYPRDREFNIEIEGVDPDIEYISLFNSKNIKITDIPVKDEKSTLIREYLYGGRYLESEGSAFYAVDESINREGGMWYLKLPHGNAYINIDGVTQWDESDHFKNMSIWSPDPAASFLFSENRWMISPYQQNEWVDGGTKGKKIFRVHNNGLKQRKFRLNIEFPADKWPVHLSNREVLLDAGASADVEVEFELPLSVETAECYVRATPHDNKAVSTYASLIVHAGVKPSTAQSLNMPLVFSPYSHENREYGYSPDYPVDNQLYYDLNNSPFVVSSDKLFRFEDNQWKVTDLNEAIVASSEDLSLNRRWSSASSKIAFDADNYLYLLASSGGDMALFCSSDEGETFTVNIIPSNSRGNSGKWDIEQFSGHNIPNGPPPIIRFTPVRVDESDLPIARRAANLRWRRENRLDLIIAEKDGDGKITFEEPIAVTSTALGLSNHSGIPSSIVSNGSNVHIVWGEATDPMADSRDIPGVPAYIATYDRGAKEMHKSVLLGYGPPANDVHNTPSITMDSKGYLHIIVGTHGRPFQYLRSLRPNDVYGGWTKSSPTDDSPLRQTYVGLVCSDDDALHLVFRLWYTDKKYIGGKRFAALAHQRKLPDSDWESPEILIVPPLNHYGIYYHRLTVDRAGAIKVSYDFWSTFWFYRNEQRGAVAAGSGRPGAGWGRAVITSPDGGENWRFQ